MHRMYSWKALKTLSGHPKCAFHARYDWQITFPDWKQKKLNFFLFFFEKKLRKRRIVPKNEKGDPLGFNNILSLAKYQKIRRGDSFETLKIFEKKFAHCRKSERVDPLESSGFVGYVTKVKNERGALCSQFALVELGLSELISFCKKWYIRDELCGLTKKKEKKTSHCNSRAFFLKRKMRRLKTTISEATENWKGLLDKCPGSFKEHTVKRMNEALSAPAFSREPLGPSFSRDFSYFI